MSQWCMSFALPFRKTRSPKSNRCSAAQPVIACSTLIRISMMLQERLDLLRLELFAHVLGLPDDILDFDETSSHPSSYAVNAAELLNFDFQCVLRTSWPLQRWSRIKPPRAGFANTEDSPLTSCERYQSVVETFDIAECVIGE